MFFLAIQQTAEPPQVLLKSYINQEVNTAHKIELEKTKQIKWVVFFFHDDRLMYQFISSSSTSQEQRQHYEGRTFLITHLGNADLKKRIQAPFPYYVKYSP